MTYSPNFRGDAAKGSSRQLQTNYVNGTLSTILKGVPVSLDSASQLALVDVTSAVSVGALVGMTSEDIAASASGGVMDAGRVSNVTTSFAVRDVLYIDKTGALTNIKPEPGVNGFLHGDYAVLVGVVVQNEFDSMQKDIKLTLSVTGQL